MFVGESGHIFIKFGSWSWMKLGEFKVSKHGPSMAKSLGIEKMTL
jgi:hypothetical protein